MNKIEVSKSRSGIPLNALARPHFHELHDKYLHETADGEEFYEISPELALSYLQKHKDDLPAFDAIHCLLANSGVVVNVIAVKEGSSEIAVCFNLTHEEHNIEVPGKGKVLRMRLDSVIAQLSAHSLHQSEVEHKEGFRGGKHSKRHIEVLVEFLKETGLEVNLERIIKEFCKECNK